MNNTSSNPILVEVRRAGELESFHRGAICVVDVDSKVIFSEGDIHQICYPRSAMKFFQHLPLIESGAFERFGFTLEELALMCGSHNGEPEHVALVEKILEKIGLDKEHLNCGPQYPTLKKDVAVLYKNDLPPHHIHNNCSGKHAGFLALCVHLGIPDRDYINPQHPIQQMILDVCSEMYEYPKEKMTCAVDGCSAPIYAVPVFNQAIGFRNLVAPKKFGEKRAQSCAMIVEAVGSFPFMVAGSHRYCTDMMNICGKKIIGKTGAEGIYCLALKNEKIGVCIKIDDGKMHPQYNVAQAFIEATGLFTPHELSPLHHYLREPIKNYNKMTTGEIKVKKDLFSTLKI